MARKDFKSSASAGQPEQADYLVITALEEERDAFLSSGRWHRLEKQLPDIHTYYWASIASRRRGGTRRRAVLTCLAGMGPTEAATRASIAVKRWSPKYVLLVGIACGVKGEVAHGDILLATQVADYSLGKVKDGEREIRWAVSPCGASLLDSAINVKSWQRRLRVPRPGPGSCEFRKGVVGVGAGMSSPTMTSSRRTPSIGRNWLASRWRRAVSPPRSIRPRTGPNF